MGSLRVVVLFLAVGCTNANNIVTPNTGTDDENLDPAVGEGTPVRLSQTDDTTIGTALSVACADGTGTEENSWYRVFPLIDEGIRGTFYVNRVNFGVQAAVGDQRVKVSLGTYSGDAGVEQLDPTLIDVLAMTTIPIEPTTVGEELQANFAAVQIPYGSKLVVEVLTEGHSASNGSFFYLGATKSPETIPGYLRAPGCSTPNPLMTSALGYLQSHLIISVSGTY